MMPRTERFLTFYLDSYLCAFRVADVREINHPAEGFRGDTVRAQLRDESIPFVDLRPRLGLQAVTLTTTSRLVILKSENGLKATLVDAVHTVVDLYADQWETISEHESLPTTQHSMFIGIASWKGESVLLLDPLKIFEKAAIHIIAS